MLNKKPLVVITGANGFIGSYLCDYFLENGFQVRELSHKMMVERKNSSLSSLIYRLSDAIEPKCFEDADYVIHCAWQTFKGNKLIDEENIKGTLKLRDYCRSINLKKFVFISSMSAHENAMSYYGKTKFILENQFEHDNELVIKPGLVLGHGGLFQKIEEFIKKHTLIPLIDGGHQNVQTLLIDDLAKAVHLGIEKNLKGVHCISEIAPTEIRNLYSAIAKCYNKKIAFVNLPYSMVKLAFQAIKFLHIPFNLSTENLLGLKQLIKIDVSESIQSFGFTPKPFSESLTLLTNYEYTSKH